MLLLRVIFFSVFFEDESSLWVSCVYKLTLVDNVSLHWWQWSTQESTICLVLLFGATKNSWKRFLKDLMVIYVIFILSVWNWNMQGKGYWRCTSATQCENSLLTSPLSLMSRWGAWHPMSGDKLCVCSFLSVHTHHPQQVILLIWDSLHRDKPWLLYWKEGVVYSGMAMGEFSLSSTRSASQQELVAA